MSFNWKSLVGSVAPILGAAIGSPFGLIAGKILGETLGEDVTDEQAMAEKLKNADPEIGRASCRERV